MMKDGVEILTIERMKAVYGEFWDVSPRQKLSKRNVPKDVHPMIPYAEFWGILSPEVRDELIEKAPRIALENMAAAMLAFEETVGVWLSGLQSSERLESDEAVAFMVLQMVADEAPIELRIRESPSPAPPAPKPAKKPRRGGSAR